MRLSFAIKVRWFFTLAVVFGMLHAGLARERGPRVEVVCPSPPIPAKGGGTPCIGVRVTHHEF